jgi:hypothetical protein
MRIPYVLVVSALLVGCASRPAATPAGEPIAGEAPPVVERMTLSVAGRNLIDARLDGTTLYGVAHDVTHFDDGYRGNSRRGFLFLSEPSPGRISGVIGNGALTTVDYQEDPASGRIYAQGRWAWRYFAIEIARNVITVSNASCTDTYRRLDEASDLFIGSSSCWTFRPSGPSGVSMRVPDAFFQRAASEQVVFLTAFLS